MQWMKSMIERACPKKKLVHSCFEGRRVECGRETQIAQRGREFHNLTVRIINV